MRAYRYRLSHMATFATLFGASFATMGTILLTASFPVLVTVLLAGSVVFTFYGLVHNLLFKVRIAPDAVIRSGSIVRRIGFTSVRSIRLEENLVALETWWYGTYSLIDIAEAEDLVKELLEAAARYPSIEIHDCRKSN